MKETNEGIRYAYLGFVICSLVTVIVASYIYLGTAVAGVIGIAGAFSVIGWYSTRNSWSNIQDNILVVYLFTVMGILAQNIEEWILGGTSSAIFGNHIHFALYSIGLATLFVFGAMGLTYKNSLGIFMTWFIFNWAIIQGVTHFVYPIISEVKFYYFPGQVMSIIPILLGGYGIKKLLSNDNVEKEALKNERINYSYLCGVIIFIVSYASIFYSQAGFRPMLIVCGSMVGGMVIWLKTTFKIHIDTKKIIPVYLFTLTLFFLHMTEEFITDFPGGINSIFHTVWTMRDFGILIALVGPIIWVFGGIALYYKNPIGYYLAWFIFFGMLIGEPTHYLVFPMLQSGRYSYFSGMWTSLFPMVPAIYGVYLILAEYKKEKTKNSTSKPHTV